MKILITGSAGFICGYVVSELLAHGHEVIGVDNFSKYGKISKSYDNHPNYHFVEGDAKNTSLLKSLITDCDQLIAAAAMVGGISYFHELAYDLLTENEKINASTFDAAIWAFNNFKLKKINILTSSLVYECANKFPVKEGDEILIPPPKSTYGFQKLACEYFIKGAFEQYKLPYTIIRPFNCVGVGEHRSLLDKQIESANIKMSMSHVVPDLIKKILQGQDPLHILGSGEQIRHYTYAKDMARGIRLCIENNNAINQDFNIAAEKSTSILELANQIWQKIHPNKFFQYVSDKPFVHDVKTNITCVKKAKDLLNFSANTTLNSILDELIPWISNELKENRI